LRRKFPISKGSVVLAFGRFKSIVTFLRERRDTMSRRCNRWYEAGCRKRSSSISSFETSHLTARRFSPVSRWASERDEGARELLSHPIFETRKIRRSRISDRSVSRFILPRRPSPPPLTTLTLTLTHDAARLSLPYLSPPALFPALSFALSGSNKLAVEKDSRVTDARWLP